MIYALFIWYLMGFIPGIIAITLDYIHDRAITVKEIAILFLYSLFGPVFGIITLIIIVDSIDSNRIFIKRKNGNDK